MKEKTTTITLKKATSQELNKLKYNHNFSTIDSLINALLKNFKDFKDKGDKKL